MEFATNIFKPHRTEGKKTMSHHERCTNLHAAYAATSDEFKAGANGVLLQKLLAALQWAIANAPQLVAQIETLITLIESLFPPAPVTP